MARPLSEIAFEMEGLGVSEDPEVAHITADRLLIETIECMSARKFSNRDVAAVLAAWGRVPKWYA